MVPDLSDFIPVYLIRIKASIPFTVRKEKEKSCAIIEVMLS